VSGAATLDGKMNMLKKKLIICIHEILNYFPPKEKSVNVICNGWTYDNAYLITFNVGPK
jgi:hypothetical protein